MHLLTWVGLFLIALGTGFTILGQQIINDRSNKLLQNKSDNNAQLSQDNIRLSTKLSELYQQIAATVSGGESFCYLFPTPSFGKLNTIDFHILHKGEYPIYDVSIKVWDESCLKQRDYGQLHEKHFGYRNKEVTLEEWSKMKKDPNYIIQSNEMKKEAIEQMRQCLILNDKIGTITPGASINVIDQPIVSLTIPKGIDFSKFSQEYNVSIVSINGQYKQEIKLDIRSNRPHIYSKVEKIISDSKRIAVREYESIESEGFAIKNLK